MELPIYGLLLAIEGLFLGAGAATPVQTGQNIVCRFGYSIESCGDLDGDGTSELIVGSPFNDEIVQVKEGLARQPNDSGALWVFSLSKSTVLAERRGLQAGGRLGTSIAALPFGEKADRSQCLAGEPGYDKGRGRLLLLNSTSLQTELEVKGSSPNAGLGAAVTYLREDDKGQLIAVMSQPGLDVGDGTAPKVSVMRLPSAEVIAERTFGTGEVLGRHFAIVPDINGDGIEDLATGIPLAKTDKGEKRRQGGSAFRRVPIVDSFNMGCAV
ncbi:MAG: hypothetical protein IPK67_18380 [Planctomycetes bacterium]|nr:hypothetical protein [Planctomycetota bacterium]